MTKRFCDICKKEVGNERTSMDFSAGYQNNIHYDLCLDCAKKIGYKKPERVCVGEDVKTELFECVRKVVHEVLEEN